MQVETVTVVKGKDEAVVNVEDVEQYTADGWKLKQAEDAPSDGPKTQPIAKSAADMKTSK